MIKNDLYFQNTDKLGVAQIKTNLYGNFLGPPPLGPKDYFAPGSNYNSAIIGNIYVNLDFIYRLSQEGSISSQDKKEKNEIVIFDFVKTLMASCNTAIGNVANFNIFIDNSVARIVDVNFTGNRTANVFPIELQNLSSVVRKYKIESQIFPELSSIIAIGAQVQGGALANDVNTLIDYNKGLTDRIVTEKVSPNSSALTPQDKLNNTQDSFAEFLVGVFGYVSGGAYSYNIEKSSRLANSLRDLINLFQTYERGDASNRAILPTKLSIEMDGIGGIIIGNIFKISNDVIPQGYQGTIGANLAYVVLGIGHSIQNNDWVTRIDAQFIILDSPQGTKLTPKATFAFPPLQGVGPLTGLPIPIQARIAQGASPSFF
jgi:hypothetical protein